MFKEKTCVTENKNKYNMVDIIKKYVVLRST